MHAKRQGVADPKWELDHDEIRSMKPAVAKVTETFKLYAENYEQDATTSTSLTPDSVHNNRR